MSRASLQAVWGVFGWVEALRKAGVLPMASDLGIPVLGLGFRV